MKRILIATDGSDSSNEAVDLGPRSSSEHGSTVYLVHVEPAVDIAPWSGFGMAAAAPHVASAQDRAPLDDAVARAEERGVPVIGELLTGGAVDDGRRFCRLPQRRSHRDGLAWTRSGRVARF